MPAEQLRIRCRFGRIGRVRFTSQRDMARAWERALRRSGLAVAWSEGFSPHPLLSFGLGLPTGCESVAEYVDIRLAEPCHWLAEAAPRLTELLPDGVFVLVTADLGIPTASLQQAVTSCSWELEVEGVPEGELGARIRATLAAESLPVTRVRKGTSGTEDIRPQLRHLSLVTSIPAGPSGTDGATSASPGTRLLRAEMATRPRGVRPTELVTGLGTDVVLVRARRTQQWIERGGVRSEPLSLDGTVDRDLAPDHGCAAT